MRAVLISVVPFDLQVARGPGVSYMARGSTSREPTFAFVLATLASSPQFESRSHLPVPSTPHIDCPCCLETPLNGFCCSMTLLRCPELLILPLAAGSGSAAPHHASTGWRRLDDGDSHPPTNDGAT